MINRKQHFEQLFHQLIEINILSEDLDYLFRRDKNDNELLFYSPLFNRMLESMKALFALRYCTFLNDRENFNLSAFLDDILLNFDTIEFSKPTEKNEIQNYKKKLSHIKKSTETKVLKHIRNKHLAHIDKDRANTDLGEITLDSVQLHIEEIKEIFMNLGSKLFNIYYKIDLIEFQKDHSLLYQLSTYYNLCDMLDDYKYKRKEKVISITEIEKLFPAE